MLLGKRIAGCLQPGAVLALTGPLGAGKTTLAQAVARGLCVTERMASPTFTIVQEYRSGRLPLFHFDVYRVSDPDALPYIQIEGVPILAVVPDDKAHATNDIKGLSVFDLPQDAPVMKGAAEALTKLDIL